MRLNRLETERLILRPFVIDDLETFYQIMTDADVRKYLLDDLILPRDQIISMLEKSISLFESQGYGLWAVTLRAEPSQNGNQIIGFTGYWFFHEPPQLELLYGLLRDYWGRGLATEMSRAMIDYGFNNLKLARIIASCDSGNQASVEVMVRLGMIFTERSIHEGLDTIFYQLNKS